MLITNEITIDLLHRGVTEPLEAVQYDANTRAVKVTLLNGGESWTPPAGAVASVAFKKPDGTSGWYDKLPDGTTACSLAGNAVTAIFAPQMLTAAGKVSAAVIFQDSKLNQLATFVFTVDVQANPAAGKGISNDYYKYSTMEQLSAAVDAWLTETEAEKNAFLSKADAALDAMRDVITASENGPAIVCEENGEVVSASDASDRLLHGLTLYGKTTQNGTPTPTDPVELVSVGASGAINTMVGGTNLCNPKGFGYSTYYTVDEDGYISITNPNTSNIYPAILLSVPKGTYTVSVELNKPANYYIAERQDDFTDVLNNPAIKTLHETENVSVLFAVMPGASVKARITINIGDTALPWEPYKEQQTLTASTPNGLPGIPVTIGGNYTDENGQQWICDEVDFARGVYVQRVYQETVALSSFTKYAPGAKTTRYGMQTKYSSNGGKTALCSVMSQTDYQYSMTDTEHWFVDSTFTIFVSNEKTTAFESNESITVLYNLATPVETALSVEEMAAYYTLHSNKPNTTAFNDAGAGMKIAYVADTKIYIDNKFGELAAALVHNT